MKTKYYTVTTTRVIAVDIDDDAPDGVEEEVEQAIPVYPDGCIGMLWSTRATWIEKTTAVKPIPEEKNAAVERLRRICYKRRKHQK